MTAPRNADTLIRAFLDEGQVELPDRSFDVVRREIHRTRQRVVIGPWKEPAVSTITRLAVAAAIVVAIGVVSFNLGLVPSPGRMPTQPPSPAVTQPASTPAASPSLPTSISGVPVIGAELGNTNLTPGRWAFDYPRTAGADGEDGPTVFITIPGDGWTSYEGFAADKNLPTRAGVSFLVWKIVTPYVNGCTDHTPVSPTPGASINELLTALVSQPLIEASPITDVTIDGYDGQVVEITTPADIADCPEGFWPFNDKFVQDPGEVERVYALDVDGQRMTLFARIPEGTSEADLADIQAIVDSIDIEP
jgi:hypothetical protein